MKEESKQKIAWALKEELKAISREKRDIILLEINCLVDRRIQLFRDTEKLTRENIKIIAAEPLMLVRSE